MIFEQTYLKGAWMITLTPFADNRGSFARMYCKDEFSEIGFMQDFVQVNHATNDLKGTFRGLHYQVPPYSESKLIRCTRGKVFDIIVDIRKGSDSFLKSFTSELSSENNKMILITEGFAHGYITLEDNCGLVYFHSSFYKPGFEGGLNYKDPMLGMNLPFEPQVISEKDNNYNFIDKTFTGIEI